MGDLGGAIGTGGTGSFNLIGRVVAGVVGRREAFAGVLGRDVVFVIAVAALLRIVARSSDAADAGAVVEPDRWVLTAADVVGAAATTVRRIGRTGA